MSTLKDGVDSGAVSEKVKRQVLSDGLGICAAPDCNERIDSNKTRLGECAHIIPRKVGSHPREDYTTSLEDRKRDSNLIYLCEKHHKIIDNVEHSEMFTVELLRSWKNDHEKWAKSVNKKSQYIPQDVKDGIESLFNNFQNDLSSEIKVSSQIINRLLEVCDELLKRLLISEARIVLSQIDLFLLDSIDSDLKFKSNVLSARLDFHLERVIEAKAQLLSLIRARPQETDALVTYLEFCERAPDDSDEFESIKKVVELSEPDHPGYLLLKYREMHKRGEIPDNEILNMNKSSDPRVIGQFLCQQALFCEQMGDNERRDELLDLWEKELPCSPRPCLFRVMFKTNDLYKSEITIGSVNAGIEFVDVEGKRLLEKDPLSTRDAISWGMQEIRLGFSSTMQNLKVGNLSIIKDRLVSNITECYFDNFINTILPSLLSHVSITNNQWREIVEKIYTSKVKASIETAKTLFNSALSNEVDKASLCEFLDLIDSKELSSLIIELENNDVSNISKILQEISDPYFFFDFSDSIPDPYLQLNILENGDVEEKFEQELLFRKVRLMTQVGLEEEGVKLISKLDLNIANARALESIAMLSYKNERWSMFVRAASILENHSLSEFNKTQLFAQLAYAYHTKGDDSSAIIYAEKALSNLSDLGKKNLENCIYILGESCKLTGDPDRACAIYENIPLENFSFGLSLFFADLYLRTSFSNKYTRSLYSLLNAFEFSRDFSSKMYVSAYMTLVEISKEFNQEIENRKFIEDGCFVKIEGFNPGWFFLGSEDMSLGAEPVSKGTDTYNALVNRMLGEEIQWPGERFSKQVDTHRIQYVFSALGYLYVRSHEEVAESARIGNAPIWSVNVITEDGDFDQENFIRFYEEIYQKSDKFFESYSTQLLPFSLLCRIEGGIGNAISKITSMGKGYIHCNLGGHVEINNQYSASRNALSGNQCVIDGLASLMLAESGLLEKVVKEIKNLIVPTSVLRMLREVANYLHQSEGSIGRANIGKDGLEFIPKDLEKELSLKNKLLSSANILDNLVTKEIGEIHLNNEENTIDKLLPAYFADAYRIAQESDALIFSDDSIMINALSEQDIRDAPAYFSSISLVRCLLDRKIICWDEYLRYFRLLASYRFRLLPLSANDLFESVFIKSTENIITFNPNNLYFWRLDLTLSKEYGIDDQLSADVLADFFYKIILDNAITPNASNQLFKIAIEESLKERDERLITGLIYHKCLNNLSNDQWAGQLAEEKLDLLKTQLTSYVSQNHSIVLVGN